jgi:hypothetical protein
LSQGSAIAAEALMNYSGWIVPQLNWPTIHIYVPAKYHTVSTQSRTQDQLGRLRKNYFGTLELDGPTCGTTEEHSRRMLKKAVQQGRSE